MSSENMATERNRIDENGRFIPIVSWDLIIGSCLAVGGNLLISVSMNIQKCALVRIERRRIEAALPPTGHHEYLRSLLWWMGVGLMVLGEGGNFLAYGFAPASVIAPLGTTTVVANAYISRCLGERLRWQDIFGTMIIVIGAFMIVVFSSQTDKQLTASEIVDKLKAWPFVAFFLAEVALFLLLLYLRYAKGVTNLIVLLLPAALLGSLTVIGAKGASMLVAKAFKGDISQLHHPIFYVLMIIVVVTGIFQIKFVTAAMQENDASVVVPVYFVFFTLSAILVGVFFYGEFNGLEAVRIFIFLFGCISSFVGVFMITHGRDVAEEEEAAEEVFVAEEDKNGPRLSGPRNMSVRTAPLSIPTNPYAVQPPRNPQEGALDTLSDSSDGLEIEMQDMSNTLRDDPKWPLLDKAIVKPQIGNTNDMLLSQRKPNRTDSDADNSHG